MKLPFEILHIHKGDTLEAYQAIAEQDYLRIVTLCPVDNGFVVASNLRLTTATFTIRYASFEEAYAEYHSRIAQFIEYKTIPTFKEIPNVNGLQNLLPLP